MLYMCNVLVGYVQRCMLLTVCLLGAKTKKVVDFNFCGQQEHNVMQ